jgi:hypothetical protein
MGDLAWLGLGSVMWLGVGVLASRAGFHQGPGEDRIFAGRRAKAASTR